MLQLTKGIKMRTVNVGVIGFGTVGAGVVETIYRNGEMMMMRSGVKLNVLKIADRDITSDRGFSVDADLLTTNVDEVINNPEIDIILELIGGTTFAKEVVVKSLQAKKSVITANKALLADCYAELSDLAVANGVDLYFEAAVGGGIPCIKGLREGLVANDITTVMGILNGTCNYILTRMENEKISFDVILPQAQAAGYAEAEPSLDVDGFDTAHKTVILSSIISGSEISLDEVYTEGIREIQVTDVDFAAELGYRIKLLSIIKKDNDKISMCVQPTLVPKSALIGSVMDVFNAVFYHGDIVDDVLLYGRGAGREATASAVVADIIDVAKNIANETLANLPALIRTEKKIAAVAKEDLTAKFYFRVQNIDYDRLVDVIGKPVEEINKLDATLVLSDELSFTTIEKLRQEIPTLVAIRYESL